jgi:hypothetical protein
MKSIAIILFSLISVAIFGQEQNSGFDGQTWEAPYNLPVPAGWVIERFPIPISFAPEIPYKGVEDIRFSPGWAKKNSDEYWSYAFLWYLEGSIKLDCEILERNLKAYYTGLITVNGSKIPAGKVIPVEASFKEIQKEAGDIKTFAGTIRMLDYMKQEPIVLQCKTHLKSCPGGDKTMVFYELSPMSFTHSIWQSLDKLWQDFTCKKM